MSTSAITDWKELANRECVGLVVSLSWSPAANQIRVAVGDQRLDEELHLDVPGECALDAFHHPFAYAAVQGIGFGCGTRACGDLESQNLAERSAVR